MQIDDGNMPSRVTWQFTGEEETRLMDRNWGKGKEGALLASVLEKPLPSGKRGLIVPLFVQHTDR